MPGPPPTPTHLKLLRGNPGHQKPRPEPAPLIPEARPEPPPHITGFAVAAGINAPPPGGGKFDGLLR